MSIIREWRGMGYGEGYERRMMGFGEYSREGEDGMCGCESGRDCGYDR